MITNLMPTGPLSSLYFLRCTGTRVMPDGSLTLTFGPWTLSTEGAGWRVLKDATILAGQGDTLDIAGAIDGALTGVALQAICPISKFDLRLMLSGKYVVESFAVRQGTRSIFAIRREGKLVFDYEIETAWAVAPIHGHQAGHA